VPWLLNFHHSKDENIQAIPDINLHLMIRIIPSPRFRSNASSLPTCGCKNPSAAPASPSDLSNPGQSLSKSSMKNCVSRRNQVLPPSMKRDNVALLAFVNT
jgi:hypothetical protein